MALAQCEKHWRKARELPWALAGGHCGMEMGHTWKPLFGGGTEGTWLLGTYEGGEENGVSRMTPMDVTCATRRLDGRSLPWGGPLEGRQPHP